ncbi:hypothetical protein LINGRAHAP2_LOCUS22762 [Linum grandiflorum]
MLLRDLLPETPPAELQMYLRHIWRLCDPSKPDQLFALGTIWTDGEGVRIQGDALRNFAAVIEKRIAVGSVYKITGFTLRPPRAAYRTCRFPQWLAFTALTTFELQPEPAPAFADEAMDYVRLAKLRSRLPSCPYVTCRVSLLCSSYHSLLVFACLAVLKFSLEVIWFLSTFLRFPPRFCW